MEISKKVGRYEVVGPLGRGGMGSVFKAWDPIFERHVALKTIAAEFFDDPEFRKRFRIEAKAAAQLKHPNIVEIHDWIEEGERVFQVLELLEGKTLQERIDADRKAREGEPGGVLLPLEEKLRLVLGVLSGLHRAHQSGIIHRDIKPDNVFVTSDGEAKILDFGLARIGGGTSITTGVLGTPGYMSPEQFAFEEIDHRTDVWSCGVLLYQLLSNRLPFPGREFNSIAKKVLHSDPERFEASTRRTPESLATILSRALKKDRNARYPSALEMAGDLLLALESLRHGSEGDDVQAASASSALWRTVDENRALLESPLLDGMLAIENAMDSRVWTLLHSDAPSVSALGSAEREYLEPLERRIEGLLAQLRDAQILWSEVIQLEKAGRLEEAISRAEDTLRAAPGSNAVVSFINRLRKQNDVERLFSEAQNLYRQGKLDEGASVLEGALKLQPEHAGLRALAREVRARIAESKTALVTNVGASPATVERVERASPIPTTAPSEDPASKVKALYAKATRLVEVGEGVRSLSYLKELLAIDPMHRAALELARGIEKKREESQRDRSKASEPSRSEQALKADELCREAQSLKESGRVEEPSAQRVGGGAPTQQEESLGVLDELLALSPEHRSAQRLRDEIRTLDRGKKAVDPITVREAEIRRLGPPRPDTPEPIGRGGGPEPMREGGGVPSHGGKGAPRHEPDSPEPIGRRDGPEPTERKGVQDPRFPDLLRQARVFLKAKRLDDATRRIQSLLAIDPQNAEALEVLESIETYHTMPWARRILLRARKRIRSHPTLSGAVAGVAVVLLVLAVFLIRTGAVPKGQVWIEIAPWSEIESVREKGRERTIELPSERVTPVLLSLTAGVYEIRFRNHLRPEAALVLEVEVLANETVELKGALSGFDHVPISIDF